MALFILRLMLAFVFFLFLFYTFGSFYAKPLVSFFAYQIKFVHPEYEFQVFKYLDKGNRAHTILILGEIHRQWKDIKGNQGYGRKIEGNFPAVYLILQPIIIFSLLAAWPNISFKYRVYSFAVAMMALIFSFLIDIPFHMISAFESKLVSDSFSGHIREYWITFLENGGRLFLALLILIISLSPAILLRRYK